MSKSNLDDIIIKCEKCGLTANQNHYANHQTKDKSLWECGYCKTLYELPIVYIEKVTG